MSRSVVGKFEIEIDIKSSGDTFHEIWGSKPHHVPQLTPNNIHGCEVHEGDFGKQGSVLLWHYTVDGKKCVAKQLVEAIDEEKKYVRFKVIEGDLLEDYKSFTASVQVIPRAEIDAVKWVLEFEKKTDDGPYPTNILDLGIAMTRDIEAHHLKP